ncbi:Riboflavin biosynthesis protein RibF [bacterium HR40]|nr:Riboflavin biosynthesis protein RibF [bacterium HR40]
MRVYRGPGDLPAEARGAAVAIGNFDGVHRGHRAVIARTRALAEELGVASGVVTFEPHPRELLDPERAPPRLTSFARKAELLRALGIDQLHVLRVRPQLLQLSPEAFVERILVGILGVRAVVTGADFRFGHRRTGDVAILVALGQRFGFAVEAMEKIAIEGIVCSSTRIRQAIAAGAVREAANLLGYAYELSGGVVAGDRLGRSLGYPTANLRLAGRRPLLPADGIYAVRAGIRRSGGWSWHPAVASLGVRPTFGGGERRLEVHLLDGRHELYGLRMRVAFLERLREERRFDTLEALVAEMARDCARAREVHGLEPAP